jgi:integrase
MAIEKLSATRIASLKKNGMYGDGGNLWLQVTNNGANKSWIFRWTEHATGKELKMGLGSLDTVDLDTARDDAKRCRLMVHRGKDPKQERDATKLDARIAAGKVKTVKEVAEEYYEIKYVGKGKKRRRTTRLHLDNYVIATIGDMPIQKVDTNVILDQILCRKGEPEEIRELWLRKNPTAGEVQGHLDRMFNFARSPAKKYYSGDNPASWEILQHVLPSSEEVHQTKHHKSLPYKDAGRFFCAVRTDIDRRPGHGGYRTMASFALEFDGLSGVRIGEVTKAQRKEFDFETMIWTVPPENKKSKKKPRRIPITTHMKKVLDQVLEHCRNPSRRNPSPKHPDPSPEALMFPGYHRGTKMDDSTVQDVIKRIKWEDPKLTVHGFRSTLRDWCRANRFPPEWWEIQVDHKLGDRTSQSYGHDDLLEQRRGMMELYGEYCSKPAPEPKAGKVFNLSDKRRTA